MKKVHIIQHNGGRLANQLWNYASIYAYCLEKKYECLNPSFFRYAELFDNVALSGFGKFYKLFPIRKVFTIKYNVISWLQSKLHKIVFSDVEFVLPPSQNENAEQMKMLTEAEKKSQMYFSGWKFRNEVGLKKYHEEIVKLFTPTKKYAEPAHGIISTAKETSEHVVGVHIRQGDYKTWLGGKHYVSPQDAAQKMQSFLDSHDTYTKENTTFIVCSDETIDSSVFGDLKVMFGPNTAIGDLYALSLTDEILGSHSTYGPWAAYFGGVTFTEFSHV